MINKEPIFINSKITGGHYALKMKKGKKPFENPMNYYTKIKLYPSDIIADIGAYIGEYSLYAVKQKVSKIYCYEPTPYTFKILEINKKPNMELFNLAVTGKDYDFINLYLSKGIGVTNSIVKNINKVGFIKVPTIKYENAIKDATVVKIDVEGAEYTYNIIQPNLRAIIIEFHPISRKPWKEWALNIINNIEKYYKPIIKPTFKCGWDLTGCWEK